MKPYRHEPIKTGTTAARELRIDLRPAEELKPNPANARVHSKKQIRQIANSIDAFGFNVRCWSMPSSTSSTGTVDYSHVANLVDRGANAVSRSPDPRTGPGRYDR